MADVVPGDDEIATVIAFAAHDDMDMRIVGVPVIDSYPVESRAEIASRLGHQLSGKGLEIREPVRVLRRHNEPEMMPVALAAAREGAVVGVVMLGVEHPSGRAIPGHAVPPQIAEMRAERRSSCTMPYHTRLDRNVARPIGHEPRGSNARRPPAAEGAAPPPAPGSMVQPAGFLGGGQRSRQERLGSTDAAAPSISHAPRPDADVVVADHGADAREVRTATKRQ